MTIRESEVPAKDMRVGSIFDRIISPQERRVIQAAAPRTFKVHNDRDPDGSWSFDDVNAMRNACAHHGYRIQSRRVSNEDPKRRLMWISYEPSWFNKKKKEK